MKSHSQYGKRECDFGQIPAQHVVGEKRKRVNETKKMIENDEKKCRNEPTWTGLNLRINFRGPRKIISEKGVNEGWVGGEEMRR